MRTQFSKLALAATLALALAFTLSCSSDNISDGGGGGGEESVKSSSSSSGFVPPSPPSSSSSVSTQSGIINGTPVNYEGETYQTVVIGTQTWMAKNLNYNAEGSKCYDNNESNCATYGRLYDWVTAMALPDSCVSSNCSLQINAKHRGICPSGWHIPSNADWDKLVRYVDGSSGTSSPYYSPTAGRYLKAASGWNSSGNGEDKYGFSALPGGGGYSGGNFHDVGNYGNWWSASEYNSPNAYFRYMDYHNEYVYYNDYDKSGLFSVRCLQDEGEPAKSSSSQPQVAVSSSSSAHSSSSSSPQTGVVHGTPVTYQGETYQTVVIGTQTWMARNLNYNAEGSKCYNDEPANCNTYGRLYDWATAMVLPDCGYGTSCASQIGANHRGICPSGWHIPSNADWDKLVRYVDGSSGTSSPYESPTAGRYLKATSGWYSSGNGEDSYGFSALPGGFGRSDYVGGYGFWWSASENDSNIAYLRGMGYDYESVLYYYYLKSSLFSVRCLQD